MYRHLTVLFVTGLFASAMTSVFAQTSDSKPQRTIPSGAPTGIGMIDNPSRPLTPKQKAAAEKRKADRQAAADQKNADKPAARTTKTTKEPAKPAVDAARE
jgi:hypothetical protein